MKFRYLVVALALAGMSGVAAAQASSNPFARPAAGAPTAASASGAPGLVTGQLPGAAAAPGGMPGLPGMSPLGVNGIPGLPGMPDPNAITEDVQASRVGTINGARIYRGSNTYLFEKASEKKLVRNLVAQAPSGSGNDSSKSVAGAATGAQTPKSLPSFVGKPAPKN
jgi:hypothetical protein